MKIVKLIENIFLILGSVMFVVAGLLSYSLDETLGIRGFATGLALMGGFTVLCLFVGVFLYFVENKALSRLGLALVLGCACISLGLAIVSLGESAKTSANDTSISYIIAMVGSIIVILAFFLDMTYLILEKALKVQKEATSAEQLNNDVELLEKWKKLLDDKMITEEEFEAKRKAILHIK